MRGSVCGGEGRQIKGIWDYIESQLKDEKEVSPGVIFVRRPGDKERMKLIEDMFEDEGIPVVWQDESIEERKGGLMLSGKLGAEIAHSTALRAGFCDGV